MSVDVRNHHGDDTITTLRHAAAASRDRAMMIDEAISIHSLTATMDDIKRNPTQPTSEEATEIEEILSSYSPSDPLSSLHSYSSVLCSMQGNMPVYRDQSTNKLLDPNLVHKAMDE